MFQRHYGLILGVAVRFVPSPDLAEDVVQQVYIDFVYGKASAKWDLEKDISSLLFKITKARAMDLWRDRLRRNHCPIDDVTEILFYTDDDPGDCEAIHERIRLLEQCLERLNPKTRKLVRRHYYDKVSLKEIAESESLNPSTMYRFFRKVRLLLKKCIEQTLLTRERENEQ